MYLIFPKADSPHIAFRLAREMQEHTRQCFHWCNDSRIVPCELGESWGPSEPDLQAAAALEYTIQVDFTAYDDEPEDWSGSEEGEECLENEELYEQLESMALRDQYTSLKALPSNDDEYSSDGSIGQSPVKKRRRQQ